MMQKGKHNYSFRNTDLMYTKRLSPNENARKEAGCILDDSWEIVTKETDSRLVKYFSGDLLRFLGEAFGIYLRLKRVENIAEEIKEPYHKIFLLEADDLEEKQNIQECANAENPAAVPVF